MSHVLLCNYLYGWNRYTTPDAAFDVAWHESNCNLLSVGCGDGSIILLDSNKKVHILFIKKLQDIDCFVFFCLG